MKPLKPTQSELLEDENYALRAEIARLRARVSELVKLLDDQYGTPCEQIRHEQEVERLLAALKEIESQCNKGISHTWIRRVARIALKQKVDTEYSTGNKRYPREEDCEDNDEGA